MAGFERLAAGVVHRRWLVVAAWLLAVGALLPFARTIEDRLTVAARVAGSESAAVEEALASRFGSPFARWVVLVVAGVPGPDTPDGRVLLESAVRTLNDHPHVTRTFSYLDDADSLFVGAAGSGTFLVVGLDRGNARAERMLPGLRTASNQLEREIRRSHPEATVRWTGEIALNADLRAASAAAAEGAERRALPLTLAVLLLAFGALAAAMVPLFAAAVAVGVTLGLAAVASAWWPLSIVLQNVVSMLGIGLGIDYALLMVSRFRAARAGGSSVHHAAVVCGTRAGPTVVLSAGTVAIGFAALLLVPLDEIRAIAVGGAARHIDIGAGRRNARSGRPRDLGIAAGARAGDASPRVTRRGAMGGLGALRGHTAACRSRCRRTSHLRAGMAGDATRHASTSRGLAPARYGVRSRRSRSPGDGAWQRGAEHSHRARAANRRDGARPRRLASDVANDGGPSARAGGCARARASHHRARRASGVHAGVAAAHGGESHLRLARRQLDGPRGRPRERRVA